MRLIRADAPLRMTIWNFSTIFLAKSKAKSGYTISLPSPCNSRSSFGARAGVS